MKMLRMVLVTGLVAGLLSAAVVACNPEVTQRDAMPGRVQGGGGW